MSKKTKKLYDVLDKKTLDNKSVIECLTLQHKNLQCFNTVG